MPDRGYTFVPLSVRLARLIHGRVTANLPQRPAPGEPGKTGAAEIEVSRKVESEQPPSAMSPRERRRRGTETVPNRNPATLCIESEPSVHGSRTRAAHRPPVLTPAVFSPVAQGPS